MTRVEDHRITDTVAGNVDLRVLVPESDGPLRVLFLLHGRGGSASDWDGAHPGLDAAMASGAIAPHLVVAVDGPWSDRGSWWVDSLHERGRPVRTAILDEVLPWVSSRFEVRNDREGRVVAGASMGGAGAVHWLLTRPDLFAAAVALSPAVHDPQPPIESNARLFGAFGRGSVLFDAERYTALHDRAALAGLRPGSPVRVAILVGDQEATLAEPEHDLVTEAARLYSRVRRSPGISAHVRVMSGAHDHEFWNAALLDGLALVN